MSGGTIGAVPGDPVQTSVAVSVPELQTQWAGWSHPRVRCPTTSASIGTASPL